LSLLSGLIEQDNLRSKDFTDDKLEKVLDYISEAENWRQINNQVSRSGLEVYDIEKTKCIRLDAAPEQGYHSVKNSKLFEYGYSKHHNPKLGMMKIMLACVDNEINGFGYPLAHLTVPGDQADDGLYIPIIKECEAVLSRCGLNKGKLYLGDSKMGSKENRHYIWDNGNHYLSPLSKIQLPEKERVMMIKEQDEKKYKKVYKKDKQGKRQLIAQGFEQSIEVNYQDKEGKKSKWLERRIYVKSSAYAASQEKALDKKIETTTTAIKALLVRKQGKKSPKNRADLQNAIDEILEASGVMGLLEIQIEEELHKKKVKPYGGRTGRVDKWSTFQIHFTKDEESIIEKKKGMGWQVYATTISKKKLDFEKIVWKYRAQNRIESRFNDLRNKVVPLLPLFLKKDNRIGGLVNVLMLCLKVCSVMEFKIAKNLKKEEAKLDNIFEGNPKRSTSTPTAKRVLQQFKGISIVIINQLEEQDPIITMTDLNPNMLKIIRLLGFKSDIYTKLPEKIQMFFSRKKINET